MKYYFKCSIGNAEVEVEANCLRGSIGNREEPPEGPEVEIRTVSYKDRDITKLIDRAKVTNVFDTLTEDCAIQFESGDYDGE